MIHKLQRQSYLKVQELFNPLRYQLFPAAVLEGLQPGDIYVDDVNNPRTAFMVTREVWAYLAGDPDNARFNQALNQAISEKAFGSEDSWGFLVSSSESWDPAWKEVFQPHELVPLRRRHYIGTPAANRLIGAVPEGYELRLIDESLLDWDTRLPDDVNGMLNSWKLIPDASQRGFGYVAIKDAEITAHAIVDVVVGSRGDIGLETAPEHRQRGLGTALSAATANYGFEQRGLNEILWDCNEDNLGSLRIAEKLGFQYQTAHSMYIFDYDPYWNQFSLGQYKLDCGTYTEAQTHIDKAINLGGDEVHPMTFFLKASAMAGLGEREAAFECFQQAVEAGWGGTEYALKRPEFLQWHDTPDWKTAMEGVRSNRKKNHVT